MQSLRNTESLEDSPQKVLILKEIHFSTMVLSNRALKKKQYKMTLKLFSATEICTWFHALQPPKRTYITQKCLAPIKSL